MAQFKKEVGATAINVIRNPKTDLRFFQSADDSTLVGAVGKSWEPGDDTVVSEVCGEDGVAFFMLHTRSENSDNLLASL